MAPFTSPSDPISAVVTDEGRTQIAREILGLISFSLVGFNVGREGYDDTNPVLTDAVVPGATALGDSIYPDTTHTTGLTGAAASIVGGAPNTMILSGVDASTAEDIPLMVSIQGADAQNNGMFQVLQKRDATSYTVKNVNALPAADSNNGSITWTLYKLKAFEAFSINPGNIAAPVCKIPRDTNGRADFGLGEIGVWAHVDSTSSPPPAVGTVFLFAIAHFPLSTKNAGIDWIMRPLIAL